MSAVSAAEGSGVRSETRIDAAHVFPFLPVTSDAQLSRCHEERGGTRTSTRALSIGFILFYTFPLNILLNIILLMI